ncbi:phosphoribosylamine--glycine ligase [Ornithinimicrobium sediminis]|uniref:phosphoribosylamine--glycine ligase n=1 Tax=Ornithinimicrobium sediminis TaxID=2904603 RepID=UPI001E48E7FE|nr:phosphoribosylamine--glycine ligase [Ornithinimicrobium sediminis]
MKILVVGSGAREHALVRALLLDAEVEAVVAAPGNPGIAAVATCLPGVSDPTDASAVVAAAREQAVDLVVIGPEAPLVAGVADAVRDAGFACFGPSAQAARLEGSKSFAKEVMAAADVPTARAHVCTTVGEVQEALDATGAPYVVKEDGLAAGKGVVVTDDLAAALEHGRSCLAKPHGRVVVEDYLDGPEVSLFCISDGTTVVPLEPAQDFKRIGDGDAGLNTGGMGAYSPLPWVQEQVPDLVGTIVSRVAQPTVAEMRRRGTPFAGVLYIGLALTSAGPRVVEFNARFGDPETQSVLARLQTPLGGLLQAAATGTLGELPPLRWRPESAVTVVLAAQGYPEAPVLGAAVDGTELVEDQVPDTHVLHAGTRVDDEGVLRAAGGRVLSVVALGHDLHQARERAYAGVDLVAMKGSQHRTDIAARAAEGRVQVPSAGEDHARGPASGQDAPFLGESYGIPGHLPVHSGKVRDLYAPLDPQTGLVQDDRLLMVASDRISAYDHVLETPVPDKGVVLTRLSRWWFERLEDLVPHHVIDADVPQAAAGRGLYVRRLRMLPVEAVARAYLTGGGLAEYTATGAVSGVRLPEGLVDGSRLPEPVFTPSTKAPQGEHDRPMTFEEVVDVLGPELAARVRDLTVAILGRGNAVAEERGILIADTKVEFGVDPVALGLEREEDIVWPALDPDAVQLVLADEVLTPDSSRFWRAAEWEPGRPQTSYDKQVLRDWLTGPDSGWDRHAGGPPPPLPDDVVELTRARYVEAYETLTGERFERP